MDWTEEGRKAFDFCRAAVSNCQGLYFLEDTATPILQTDASDYGIGGYMYMVTNGQVRVVRFFSKSLVGSQLNRSAREKECYAIYYCVKLFDNRYFILKTDHMNLCDITAHTVLLYVLFCLIYMYRTYCKLYMLYITCSWSSRSSRCWWVSHFNLTHTSL